jgi:hypothetical protein
MKRLMNWKGYASKRSWPNLKFSPGICLEGQRMTTQNLSPVSGARFESETSRMRSRIEDCAMQSLRKLFVVAWRCCFVFGSSLIWNLSSFLLYCLWALHDFHLPRKSRVGTRKESKPLPLQIHRHVAYLVMLWRCVNHGRFVSRMKICLHWVKLNTWLVKTNK